MNIRSLHVSSKQEQIPLESQHWRWLSELSLQSRTCALPPQYIHSRLHSFYFPTSLEQIIALLLQRVKSALMTFFPPSWSPFQCDSRTVVHRSAQAAVVVGDRDVLQESEELTGLRWQARGRSKLLRPRPLQGLEALNREELVFGTVDGHRLALPDWIKSVILPSSFSFNPNSKSRLGKGHCVANKKQ